MKKIRIGVMGVYRGTSVISYCAIADNAELVALCDKWEDGLKHHKEKYPDMNIAYYTDFDQFIQHDMDAVILANYANEHAPFAIKAMKAGKHVYSEVLPVQTMKEAVELIEAVEETGMTYAYAENYCYMPAPYEIRRLYREGALGELEYAECEYVHNCESIWPEIAYGDPDHWRNNMFSTYYCTHSLGPIIHSTGLRPVKVIGIEGTHVERNLRSGSKAGSFGMELVTLENGGVVKSLHGGLYRDSIWYCLYGSKGRAEAAREEADNMSRLYVSYDETSGSYGHGHRENYIPQKAMDDKAAPFGHGGSDFYAIYNFVEKLLGNPEADIIDVYEALDMSLPGLFAYRSILAGNIPMEIPNLRDKDVREQYRNDVACTVPAVAGDQLMPTYSKGTPDIDPSVYEEQKRLWHERQNMANSYTQIALNQGSTKK